MKIRFVSIAIFSALIIFAKAEDHSATTALKCDSELIPKVSSKCILCIYGPIEPLDFPLKGSETFRTKDINSWQQFLEANGAKFPNGGFAIYFKPTKSLLVATTKENQGVVEALFCLVLGKNAKK
jgi:hypothetical protein